MRELRVTEKIIITVATTGGLHGKDTLPQLPEQPEEIAQAAYECWNEGASIVHIHARDKDGKITNSAETFKKINHLVREKCDIIIQNTTGVGFAPSLSAREKMQAIEAEPEMCSLNMGSTVAHWGGQEGASIRTRSDLEWGAQEMLKRGIKPEMEVYNPAMLEEVDNLISKDMVKKPYWISFVMDMHRVSQGAIRYSPQNLLHYMDMMPTDAMFTVVGVGPSQLPLTTLSILFGGHLRVGLEDNIYYKRGVHAESNAQLVARAARIARELGCEVASPEEARQMLNIPSLANRR